MKKLFLVLILFCAYFCKAQNYQCLQSGVKHYFTNANGYLRGIRIDSIKSFADSTIYYPYHTPRGYYRANPNLDSSGGSWLGKKVMQLNDGTFLFDNLWNDTVVIKTQAHVGDSWVFYNDTTSLYYKADLIGSDTMTILGAVDSIKRILITAHNKTGIVTTDPANNFQIILSKNNGFAQVFDLYTFPYHAPDSAYWQGRDYYLDYIIPVTGPIIPTQASSSFSIIQLINPTYAQLYQWNVGDVYEYSSCNGKYEHPGGGCYFPEKYKFDTITAVNITSGNTNYNYNALIYTNDYYSVIGVPSYGSFNYSISQDSGALNCSSTALIDTTLMPEEFHQKNIYGYQPNDSGYCLTNTLYTVLWNIEIAGAIYKPIFEVFVRPTFYKSPLGLLSSSTASANNGYNVYSQELLYYNRGGIPCGSIKIPSNSVQDIKNNRNSINIFPNPATDELNITSNDKISSVVISNLIGQTIYNHEYNTEKVQVDVTNLPAGVYFIKINGWEVRRFVKE